MLRYPSVVTLINSASYIKNIASAVHSNSCNMQSFLATAIFAILKTMLEQRKALTSST